MAVDKNLFLYDLAVVAIMKNEAPYVKEWLDYHILAGVNHFYIYDNESPDNLKEILQPYIDAGIVTYTFFPGKCRQMESYNDAVKRFKFFCRYMAWIDADEFIFPQNNKTIVEVVDEIFEENPKAGGLAVNVFQFGSNGQKKADLSKGVLERFTRRSSVDWLPLENGIAEGTARVKTIANPRKIKFFDNPHFAHYFEDYDAINENGGIVPLYSNNPPTVEKIVMNHYKTKSFEEYKKKVQRGNADLYISNYDIENFKADDRNEIFDDEILKYREFLKLNPADSERQLDYRSLCNALMETIAPIFSENTEIEFFKGQMETFLTCWKLSQHLRENILSEKQGKFFEEAALSAVHKTFFKNSDIADLRLLFEELPEILLLDYPIVENICESSINIIPRLMDIFRIHNLWREFYKFEYLMNMLQTVQRYKYA